jgi:hypothetical protein
MLKSRVLCVIALLLAVAPLRAAEEVLIVADEFPAMQVLADQLKTQEGIASRIVKQTGMPRKLAPFKAVVVYIHRALNAQPEKAMLDYLTNGGRLVALHHSISSGKRTNENWFATFGVDLPKGDVTNGGYKWIEGVTIEVANLAPDQFVTTHKVTYPNLIAPVTNAGGATAAPLPGIRFPESEVYLNHILSGERTTLLALKYTDAKTGQAWMQPTAGWTRLVGQGRLYYFMPGHSVRDFENPAYTRIVINAVIAK